MIIVNEERMNTLTVNGVSVKGRRRTKYGLAPGNLPPLYTIYIYKFKRVLKFVRDFFCFKNSSLSSIFSRKRVFLFFLKSEVIPMKSALKPMKSAVIPMKSVVMLI